MTKFIIQRLHSYVLTLVLLFIKLAGCSCIITLLSVTDIKVSHLIFIVAVYQPQL